MIKKLRPGPAGKKAGSRAFLCLQDILSCYGQMTPDHTAILAPGRPPLTYGALLALVNDVVCQLRRLGVGPSDRVAVALPNGAEAAVAMIAVAAGAVCVPLNPGFTADECQRYFGELRVSALLTRADVDSACRGVAQTIGIHVIDLAPSQGGGAGAFSLVEPATGHIIGNGLAPGAGDAFILMTSGTSSRPKMVPLTHAAVCRSAYNVGATLGLGARDRLLNVLPLFHVHGLVSGLVAALSVGSSVVCTPGFDAAAFFNWLKEFRPTWYTAVPAIHRAVLSAAGGNKRGAGKCSLRLIRSASSTLPPNVTDGLEALFGVPVIDTYGMTEAASQIAANPLARRKPGSVGPPAGAEIAILDGEGRRRATGERGEIALRGPTITRGYDNDPTATAASFRDGWFRTGDLGYLDEDEYLFIVGRIKEIINRGGQKVAPAEVEQALLSHPDVVEAAVFSISHQRLGEDVAAAVVLRQGAKVGAETLRGFARERLAGFKVPGLIRIVPEIPKGPAGKIRRNELGPALAIAPQATPAERDGEIMPPRSELECELARIWTALLELSEIGIDEDVFVLGADSITVTQLLSRLRLRFGVDFSFKDIFDAPTVAGLAARIESLAGNSADISRSLSRSLSRNLSQNLGDPLTDIARVAGYGLRPVSIVQERALHIERELPGLPQFNVPYAYRLKGPLDVPALNRGLAEIVRRHDSLRAGFGWRDERPVAVVASAIDVNSFFVVEDLAARVPAGNDLARKLLIKKAKLKVEQDALTAFDISRAPLFRARLLRVGADDHVLVLILHDMIVDGWSMGIFLEEISELYAAFRAGRPALLPDPALQFFDFAHWQGQWSTSDAAARQLASWKARLRGATPVFAAKRGPGGVQRGAQRAARFAQKPIHVSNDLVARLKDLGHSRGATLFMTLLTGFKTLLLARTGCNDICVATPMANRTQTRMERVIGPVANTTLIRTRIEADLSFHEALSRVRDSVLNAHAGQGLPFDIFAARLKEEDGLDPASLTQVLVVLQNAFRRPLKLPDVVIRPFANREGQPIIPIERNWLNVTLRETSSGITGMCRYKDDLFEVGAIKDWILDYTSILTKAAEDPGAALCRLAGC